MSLFGKKKKSGGHGSHWDAAVKEDNHERPVLKELVVDSWKNKVII